MVHGADYYFLKVNTQLIGDYEYSSTGIWKI